jgi:hypothetical protein
MNQYLIILLLFILLFILIFIILISYNTKYNGGAKILKSANKDGAHKDGTHKDGTHKDGTHKDGTHKDGDHKDGTHKDIEIEISSIQFITPALLSDILNIIKHRHASHTNFQIISEDDQKFYERQAHILTNKYHLDFDITHMQLCAIRGMEMQIYIGISKAKIKELSKQIKEDFQNGFDLTLIADKHKLPYILTLKQLCEDFGYNQKETKHFLRKDKPFPDELAALNGELDHILKLDPTSSLNSNDAKTRSIEFEDLVAKKLSDLHIKFKTEVHIKEEADAAAANADGDDNAEPLLTPDFLFTDPNQNIKLNGIEIKWIEVKNYPYYKHRFLEKNVQKQAKKYYNKYGNGVFIFKCGVLCDAKGNAPHADNIPSVKFIGWEK